MKRLIFKISLIFVCFLLVGCGNGKLDDSSKFEREYELLNGTKNKDNGKIYRELDIDSDNSFVYKSADEIIEMIDNKETFVVYFGFASCPWCRSVISSLMEVAADVGVYPIYYVDVEDIRDILSINDNDEVVIKKEGTKGYYKLLEKLDSVLDDYNVTNKDGESVSVGEKRIYAPNIVSIVDGSAISITTGISDLQKDAYEELTDEIKNDSYDKIKCTISCVADNKNICSKDSKC